MVTAEAPEGELVQRHLDQVKPRVAVLDKEPRQPHLSPRGDKAVDNMSTATTEQTPAVELQRSTRTRRPPARFSR